jgi:hypothetical protein
VEAAGLVPAAPPPSQKWPAPLAVLTVLPACFSRVVEFVQPYAALLQLAEPGLDERLALGVAVAAAAVVDREPGEGELERPGGECGAVSVPSVAGNGDARRPPAVKFGRPA